MITRVSATNAKAGLLFMVATTCSWLSLSQETVGGEISGSATIDCGKKLGGVRPLRSCEKPLEATKRDIHVSGTFLERIGVIFGITREKLISVTDETLKTTIWLADLCNDWNACAISSEEYQKRKDKLISLQQRYYALVARAQTLEHEPTTRGAESSPAVKDLEALLDHLIADIDRLEPEFKRR